MTYSIFIAKTGRTIEVDFDALPDVSKEYLIKYGLKQCFNDCHSSVKVGGEDDWMDKANAFVDIKLEKLESGELRREANAFTPLERELEKLAYLHVKQANPKATKKALAKLFEKEGIEDIFDLIRKKTSGNNGDKVIEDLKKQAVKNLEAIEKARKVKIEGLDFDLD